MKKVIIIGSGGAGKSTLARKLGEVLAIKVYHLDALYWKPGWEKTDNDEWKETLANILDEDEWIMDGNWRKDGDESLCGRFYHFSQLLHSQMPLWDL